MHKKAAHLEVFSMAGSFWEVFGLAPMLKLLSEPESEPYTKMHEIDCPNKTKMMFGSSKYN
jgi:hypothetical protein